MCLWNTHISPYIAIRSCIHSFRLHCERLLWGRHLAQGKATAGGKRWAEPWVRRRRRKPCKEPGGGTSWAKGAVSAKALKLKCREVTVARAQWLRGQWPEMRSESDQGPDEPWRPYQKVSLCFLFFFFNIVDLLCCVNFCASEWFSYTYTYILFLNTLFHSGLLQAIEDGFLCYAVGPYCLSILFRIVCFC